MELPLHHSKTDFPDAIVLLGYLPEVICLQRNVICPLQMLMRKKAWSSVIAGRQVTCSSSNSSIANLKWEPLVLEYQI